MRRTRDRLRAVAAPSETIAAALQSCGRHGACPARHRAERFSPAGGTGRGAHATALSRVTGSSGRRSSDMTHPLRGQPFSLLATVLRREPRRGILLRPALLLISNRCCLSLLAS